MKEEHGVQAEIQNTSPPFDLNLSFRVNSFSWTEQCKDSRTKQHQHEGRTTHARENRVEKQRHNPVKDMLYRLVMNEEGDHAEEERHKFEQKPWKQNRAHSSLHE